MMNDAIQAEHVTRLVGYLEKTVGRHHKYGRDYFICMFLNIANVVLQEYTSRQSIHTVRIALVRIAFRYFNT